MWGIKFTNWLFINITWSEFLQISWAFLLLLILVTRKQLPACRQVFKKWLRASPWLGQVSKAAWAIWRTRLTSGRLTMALQALLIQYRYTHWPYHVARGEPFHSPRWGGLLFVCQSVALLIEYYYDYYNWLAKSLQERFIPLEKRNLIHISNKDIWVGLGRLIIILNKD